LLSDFLPTILLSNLVGPSFRASDTREKSVDVGNVTLSFAN